ncbi:MAG: hypothetical protein HN413_13260 [Chloroflexi bacterium]|jgi:hypothetical protein|nr:hypothetical protein [Chloroflexota bacterium]
MKYIQSNHRWLFLFAFALLLAAALIQADSVQAVTNKTGGNNANLCMCAIRRPAPPPPPSSGGGSGSSPAPAPRNNDDDEDEPAPRRNPAPAAPAPAPTACTPLYAAPTIGGGGHSPNFPLTIGQDPDDLGFDVTATAAGGAKTNSCPGDSRSPIVALEGISVELTAETRDWINGELAQLYPGATVKDSYPFNPHENTTGTGTPDARTTIHVDSLDPGDYVVTVRATQADGQSFSQAFTVHVSLIETTITGP